MEIQKFYEQQGQNFAAFFLSDIHLRNECPEDIKTLEIFIDHLISIQSKADIYFLGDIFDFWFGFATPVKKQVQSLLLKLSHYNKSQGQVVFFEGNHDVHLSAYFNKLGFDVVQDSKVIQIQNQKVVLEHGDLFNPEDKMYLFLRRFLRQNWVRILGLYIVPSFITSSIGFYFSNPTAKITKVRSQKVSESIRQKFLKHALQRLNDTDADVFIAGHTHERVSAEVKLHNKKAQVINLGSWFDIKSVFTIRLEKENKMSFEFYKLN